MTQTNKINIIGDVHGRFKTLLSLISLLDPAEEVILAGDLVDRGPDNYEVLKYVMDGNAKAILGNHDHMLLCALKGDDSYGIDLWARNGGRSTVESLKKHGIRIGTASAKPLIEFLESLPLYYKIDGLLITHAPVSAKVWSGIALDPYHFTWSRFAPHKPIWDTDGNRLYHVYGHNHVPAIHLDGGRKEYSRCIDDMGTDALRGLQWPSLVEKRVENDPHDNWRAK